MNDKAAGLLDCYDIEVLRVRKGRSAILCDTANGCLIFKEYNGNENRIRAQKILLEKISAAGILSVEKILPAKDGALFVEDPDGKRYILKTFFESKECNIKDVQECRAAVEILAQMHMEMHLADEIALLEEESGLKIPVFSLEREFGKHNRELKKVWKYLRGKSQKSFFETKLMQKYDYFLTQAEEISADWQAFTLESDREYIRSQGSFCHGDYQYHNIIRTDGTFAVINFEKCQMDDQVRDLCLFMRKLLEKNDWSEKLGDTLLDAYNRIRPLSARSFVELYYRLAYPEKFWKIVNFYYNSGKAWIPEKNGEKLDVLSGQERAKQNFLDHVFRTLS